MITKDNFIIKKTPQEIRQETKHQSCMDTIINGPVKREVCAFNANVFGKAVVTTGVPREYKKGVITYEDKRTVSYEDYIFSEMQKGFTRKRRR